MSCSDAVISARTDRRRMAAAAEMARGRVLAEAAARQLRPVDGRARGLARELAIGHYLMMRLAAEADTFIAPGDVDASGPRAWGEALRLANGVARLMERYRRGLLALPLLHGPAPAAALQPTIAPPPKRQAPAAAPLPNRGWLRHGNRPGDFLASPRCGACTRAGTACRQPAMKNGRCRFHGGKSTGPRTEAGLARSRAARLVHGADREGLRALRSAAASTARHLAWLTPRRQVLAGYGVHPTNRLSRLRPAARAGGAAWPSAAVRHPSIDALAETPTISS